MTYNIDDRPLIRARIRRGEEHWHTTALNTYYYIDRRPSKFEGKPDNRTYFIIKDLTDGTNLSLGRAQAKELHALLGVLIDGAAEKWEKLNQQNNPEP